MDLYRLITRALILKFERKSNRTNGDQDQLDTELEQAMAQAHGAAGLIVSIGKDLVANRRELMRIILPRVKAIIPNAIYRVQFSYSLALFAALKVSMK